MGTNNSRLCVNCEEKTETYFTCGICSKILCKQCIESIDSWKIYHINICKQCRPQSLNKYKFSRIKCNKCENNKSSKYYVSSNNKIYCDFCEFEHRIAQYEKHKTPK